MSFSQSGLLTAEDYERLAWEYYQTLPLEHFMEATPHATQREIAQLDERIKRLARKIAKQTREQRQLTGQIQDVQGRMEKLVLWLRERVEQKARLAGCEDILSELSGADHARLQKWLDELESA